MNIKNLLLSFLFLILLQSTSGEENSSKDLIDYSKGFFIETELDPMKMPFLEFELTGFSELRDNDPGTYLFSRCDEATIRILLEREVFINRVEILWKEEKTGDIVFAGLMDHDLVHLKDFSTHQADREGYDRYLLEWNEPVNIIEILGHTRDSEPFVPCEVRLYGRENSRPVSIKEIGIRAVNEADPVVVIDSSDGSGDNPNAYCNPRDFRVETGGGLNGDYLRYNGYNSIYGKNCKYIFKPEISDEGCRYAIYLQWPAPPKGEKLRDYYIVQVTKDYNGAQFWLKPSMAFNNWCFIGEYRDSFPGLSTGRAEYTVNILHPVKTDSQYYTIADAVKFVKVPNIPDPPRSLRASAAFDGRINLSWSSQPAVRGYHIERRENSGGFFRIDTIEGERLFSYKDTTVTAGKTYYYRLCGFINEGDSDYSDTVSAMAFYSEVSPSDLATEITETPSVLLNWSDNSSDEEGFIIQRREKEENWRETGRTGSNITVYTDGEIVEGGTYHYRVCGFNGGEQSGYTSEVTVEIPRSGSGEPIPVPTAAPIEIYENLGDPTNDGVIDINDALVTGLYYIGKPFEGDFYPEYADVNLDGNIDTIDSLLIAQHYVGLIDLWEINSQVEDVHVELEYKCGESRERIKPLFRIINREGAFILLEQLKVRYYYTKDAAVSETATVEGSILEGITAGLNQDYCETGFTRDAGVLLPGQTTGEIRLTIKRNDSSTYIQENDYSFDRNTIAFSPWEKMTVYYQGILVWGEEPSGIRKLAGKIELPVENGTTDHWMPNTREEGLEPIRITFSGVDRYGNKVPLPEGYNNFKLLPPVDINWQPPAERNEPDENYNILTNKGSCEFVFYASFPDGDKYPIVTYKRKDSDKYYTTIYNPDYVNTDTNDSWSNQSKYGTLNNEEGYYLKVKASANENGRKLCFYDMNRSEGDRETDCFGIEFPGSGNGTIRPGDDLLLRFGLACYKMEYQAKEGEFLAVYDKKLLDLANQYIDETINEEGTATGVTDWNGDDQIHIEEWTRFSDNNTVKNAVAYGWGCYDDVNTFNDEIIILDGLSADVNTWYDYTFPAFQIVTIDDVQYYSPSGNLHSVPGLTTYAAFGDEAMAVNVFKDNNGAVLDADGGILDTDNPGNKNYNWMLNSVGSGTDCSGFVSRCTNLSGTDYKINDRDENLSEEKEGTTHLNSNTYSWAVDDRNLIVPGDIIIKPGHVAIVLKVDFLENSRDINNDLTRVTIIHATSAYPEYLWCVKNDDTWQILGNTYLPRRLIIE